MMLLIHPFLVVVVIFLVGIALTKATTTSTDFPTCKDCLCIQEANEECPNENALLLQSTVPSDLVEFYQGVQHDNPLQLNCDPHTNSSCTTTPPQTFFNNNNQDEVCAITWSYQENSSDGVTECPVSYSLQTLENESKAGELGLAITHKGACGVCSSLQDLATYIEFPDLRDVGTKCGLTALVNGFEVGVQCFMDLANMSEPCATMWIHDVMNTNTTCRQLCLMALEEEVPNNDPMTCELNDCLKCNEQVNGQVFGQVAGRTRRSSGLLSFIVRPCSTIYTSPYMNHSKNPCLVNEEQPPPPPPPVTSGDGNSRRIQTTIMLLSIMMLWGNTILWSDAA